MGSANSYAKEPRQERSRLSFDKALDAAVALLVERRSSAFTLAEVAVLAGVSIGSIYGRVGSKEDLIRTAHVREMTRIGIEQRAAFDQVPPPDEDLPATVDRWIRTVGTVLLPNAAVMAPFMLLADTDTHIAALGKSLHRELMDAFCAGLLARGSDIGHPDPEHAVGWSFTVVYSVLARWLGLGSQPEAAGEGEWDRILSDLSEMVTSFLTRPGSGAAGS